MDPKVQPFPLGAQMQIAQEIDAQRPGLSHHLRNRDYSPHIARNNPM
jgi:hypothetical protein